MVLECRGICLRTSGKHKDLFIKKKRYNYSKESECKICGIGIKNPNFRNVGLKIGCESDPNTNYYNNVGSKQPTITIVPMTVQFEQEVECPCCHAETKGRKLPQTKEYFSVVNGNKENPVYIKTDPLENKEKSYKKLAQELEKQGLKPLKIYDYKRHLGFDKVKPTYTKAEIEETEEMIRKASKDSMFDFSIEPRLDKIIKRRRAKGEGKESSSVT